MTNFELGDLILTPGHATPEDSHEDPSRALFAAWQNSAIDQHGARDNRALQREHIHHVTNNACTSQRDEYVRGLITEGSAILEYLWFGDDQTPLPSGLRRFQLPDDESPTLTLNPYVFDGDNFGSVIKLLRDAGLDRLIQYREKLYEKQAGFLFEPLARALVTNTPGYRLLESFNTTQYAWEERSLTPIERLIEEQMAEQTIRLRHGLGERDPLFAHPAAQRELNQAMHRLDEATRYDRRKLPEEPPFERAYDFFSQVIIDDAHVYGTYLKEVHTTEITSPHIGPKKFLHIVTDSHDFQTDGESVVSYAESQGLLNTPSMSRARSISTKLVSDMVLYLFDDEKQDRDYAAALEELLNRYTTKLIDDMSELVGGKFNWNRFNALATLLTAPVIADEELDGYILRVPALPKVASYDQALSRKEYRRGLRDAIGSIRKRPHEDTDTRVLQYRAMDESLARLDESAADMILHLPALEDSIMPHVPGYQPVGYDAEKRLFGLRYTPAADPYTECSTPIPEESRNTLSATYAEIGLNELAVLVRNTTGLTVGQLTQFIARTNRYVLSSRPRPLKRFDTLADYASYVKRGRLDMQCVEASHFLRVSLNTVFDKNAVRVIRGDSIPGRGNSLPAIGHQQTTFTDPETGRSYILDATPSGFQLTLWRDVLQQQGAILRRNLGANALKEKSRTAPQQEQTAPIPRQPPDKDATAYRQALIHQTKEALILQLRMIYGQDGQLLPQDRMFETVAQLPEDDIVFRSLSITMRATQNQSDNTEVAQLLQYIKALQDCDDPDLLRKVDPKGYAGQLRLLGTLHTHIGQLARLTR